MNTRVPRPPRHLTADTRAWWASVAGTFTLDKHHLAVLTVACEALDRGNEARERVAQDGAIYLTRFGEPRAHPSVAIERDARIGFLRALRELDLDIEPPKAPTRTPARY